MATLRNAFNGVFFSRMRQDQLELVDDDNNTNDEIGTISTISSRISSQPPPTPTYMFRFRQLAIALKVLACFFSIAQIVAIYVASFSYHHTSVCIRNCEVKYHEHMKILQQSFYYDIVEELPDSYLQKVENSTLNATQLVQQVSKERLQLEDAKDGTYANFTICRNNCDSLIKPIQLPLLICILHACFTFGLLIKQNYTSPKENLGIFTYYFVEGLFLFASLISLIYVHQTGEEQVEVASQDHFYPSQLASADASQIAAILLNATVLLIHVLLGLNHRRPLATDFPTREEPFKKKKAVYRLEKCQGPYFAAIMKVANCALSLGSVYAITFYTFHNFYYDTGREMSSKVGFHVEVKMIFLVPISIWHSIVCFMVMPASNRYHHPCQVQVVLAFYIIETIGLAFLTFTDFAGYAIIVAATQGDPYFIWAPMLLIASLILWIVDFSLHQFPGHDCCDMEQFPA